MPLDTQIATQGGTQANLLTRFGAVDVPPRRGPGQATPALALIPLGSARKGPNKP